MRRIYKILVDYDQIDHVIQVQKFVGSREYANQLFDAKQCMSRIYGRQAANYSLLVSFFDDKSIVVSIVPHDFQL